MCRDEGELECRESFAMRRVLFACGEALSRCVAALVCSYVTLQLWAFFRKNIIQVSLVLICKHVGRIFTLVLAKFNFSLLWKAENIDWRSIKAVLDSFIVENWHSYFVRKVCLALSKLQYLISCIKLRGHGRVVNWRVAFVSFDLYSHDDIIKYYLLQLQTLAQ